MTAPNWLKRLFASKPPQPGARCPAGSGCVSPVGIVMMLLLVSVLTLLSLYALVALWPSVGPATVRQGTETVTVESVKTLKLDGSIAFLGCDIRLSGDARLFAIVALSGVLGSIIHVLRSLTWYIGNRRLRWSWVPFYLLLPVVGAAAATVFYLVLRGGLLTPATSVEDTNFYGFAAIGALVGLFSGQALEKLREVFTTLFTRAPQGADAAPSNGDLRPSISGDGARKVSATEVVVTARIKPNGHTTSVEVAYGLPGNLDRTVSGATIAAAVAEAPVEVLVHGLEPGTYAFRLEAESVAGTAATAAHSVTLP